MTNTVDKKRVAVEILKQLGGNRFAMMVGAKGFVCSENMMGFRFMRNASKANFCRITLTVMDTYTVEFIRIHGIKITTIEMFENIYNDRLVSTFEEVTGLVTKF